jgi:Domain of unknown function (DUF4187)
MRAEVGRKGIGHDMEKKRKLKELYEESLKRQEDYRDDFRSERLEAHLREKIKEAQRVCQNLDTQAAEKAGTKVESNVFWRGLDRERENEEKERRFKRRMLYEQSPNLLGDSDDEEYDKTVQPLDDEDTELDEFEALPLGSQLEMIVHYMREKYFYCLWWDPTIWD